MHFYILDFLIILYIVLYVKTYKDIINLFYLNNAVFIIVFIIGVYFSIVSYRKFQLRSSTMSFVEQALFYALNVYLLITSVCFLLLSIMNLRVVGTLIFYVYNAVFLLCVFLFVFVFDVIYKDFSRKVFPDNGMEFVIDDKEEPIPELTEEKSMSLSEQEILTYKKLISDVLIDQKMFLNPNLTLAILSDITGIPKYQLSYFFSQTNASSFRSYINRLRIEYAVDFYRQNKGEKMTIEQWSEFSGFNSRVSFYRAFVNVMGFTPSEFIESLSH